MDQNVVALFIPMVFALVVGLSFVSYSYLKSRERQMLIEKGLSAEDIKKFFEQKKDPYTMMKIGIISVGFGTGLGIGLILQDYTYQDYWVPFSLFVITGFGFIAANLVASKLNQNKDAA
ncbi:MAG: DUF6249 domain-containing protein [Ignavibacteriaceae bacterium]